MNTPLQIEDLLRPEQVMEAWQRVKRNRGAAGTDRITIEELEPVFEQVWPSVNQSVRSGTYHPLPLRVVPIPKPSGGVRELAIPSVMDRVVQQTLAMGFSSIWNLRFSNSSFAYRPGRSPSGALDLALQYASDFKQPWAASLDIRDFFDSIPFEQTRIIINETPCSSEVEEIAMRCISCTRQDELGRRSPTAGLPQGSPLSPVLANAVMHRIDQTMEDTGHRYIRYADNLLILSPDEFQSRKAGHLISEGLKELGLELNSEKSSFAPLSQTQFLGFGFQMQPTGGSIPIISSEAMESCRSHLHLMKCAGANMNELQLFFSQWLGYYGRAAHGNEFEDFMKGISQEFLIYPSPLGTASKRSKSGYDGSPRHFGDPLPSTEAYGSDLWFPFARMMMRRVRVGAEFSRNGLFPRLSRIRVSFGRHHFGFKV